MNAFKNNTLFEGFQEDLQKDTLFKKEAKAEPVTCIISVQKILVGFSVSDIELGVFASKTQVMSKYLQGVGRLKRTCNNIEEKIKLFNSIKP